MARGTQHRKRRTQPHARVAPAAPKGKPKRVKHERWEDQLFFSRLRVHAKWVFVLLALAFALGFVFFGVGSGSTGISDVLQNFFSSSSSSGASIGSLEKKTREHPKDAKAWRDLTTKYEQKQRTPDAIRSLKRYTELRPKDADALQELAGLYSQQASTYQQEAQAAQAQSQLLSPASAFQPASTTPLGRAFADPNALQDPIASAVSQTANTKASDAYTKLSNTEKAAVAVYKRIAALNPTDATTQVQLGEAAEAGGDTKTAIAAYKKFLKLAPTDPLAPAVKQQLKTLTGSSAPKITAG